jgi:cell division septum initiation protein DivIVA
MDENLLREINFLAHSKGVNAFIRDRLQKLYKEVKKQNQEIEQLKSKLKGAEIALARDEDISGAMKILTKE